MLSGVDRLVIYRPEHGSEAGFKLTQVRWAV